MVEKTVFVVQAFEMQRKKLAPTTKTDAPSESAAMKRAESIAAATIAESWIRTPWWTS